MSSETDGQPVPVEDSGTTQNNTAPAQENESSTGDNKSELEAYQAKLAEVEARNDALSRKLGSIESTLKKMAKSEPKPAQEGKSRQDNGITAERQALEEFKAELNQEKVLNSLENALGQAGVPRPDKFAVMVMQDLGEDIQVSGRQVTVQDGGESVTVPAFIQAYLKTDRGSWMVPAKPAGTQSMTSNSSEPARKKVTMDDLNKLSPEELRSGSFDVVMGD